MAATITFTDGIGAATLTALGGTLNGWTPLSKPIVDAAHRVGNGQRDAFKFRNAKRATFKIRFLNTQMDIAERLQEHLIEGGSCVVNTDDSGNRSYTAMQMIEGSSEEMIQQVDSALLDYEMVLALESTAASAPTSMLCTY